MGHSRVEWPEILGLTDKMLTLAKDGEWESVLQLQEERWEKIQRFFQQPLPEQERASLGDAIRHLMSIDREITALSKDGLEVTKEALGALGQRRRANKAYVDNI